jgi:hypothetical protein
MSLDLFTPVVTRERFHPAFAKLVAGATDYDKKLLAGWAEGFMDRDKKFVMEFQTSFDSSFWELYLHAAFKELGMACDFSKPRPDFCIHSPQDVLVEAAVASNALGAPGVTETKPLELPDDYNAFNREAIVRLSNSLHTKHNKYLESYQELEHVAGKPFVVAIAPFDRPHFQLQAQRAIEALLYRFYVDEETYLKMDPETRGPLLAEDLPVLHKPSGEPVNLGVFCDAGMASISAVIQSTTATWSKVRAMSGDPDVIIEAIFENRREGGQYVFRGPNERYQESALDGLRVYHNPHAAYPLDSSLFDRPEIFQATSRGPVSLVNLSESRRLLANRRAITINSGMMKEVMDGMPPEKSYWYYVK